MAEIIIHDGNFEEHLEPVVAGERKVMGLIPRNFGSHPVGYLACARPFDLPTIPRNEWASRIADMKASKSMLSDMRATGMYGAMIPSRDQNGKGYCWAHSGVSAHILLRAAMGQPYADLSAFAVACMIKNFQDQGGWGAEGVEFQAAKGVPTAQFWPQQSMARGNDNPQTWENAALHKYVQWLDLDPNNMLDQLVTCALMRWPVVSDFNWWSHSVCTADVIDYSGGEIQSRIWNSWGDSWSQQGMGVLQGRKAIPNSAVAAICITPSM